MKKRHQKLTLSKETLRDLQQEPLARYAVGGGSESCDRSCLCTQDRTCQCTLDRTCPCTLDYTIC